MNLKHNLLSVFTILCFLIAFGISAYTISYKKGKISKHKFTISESLAFGDRYSLVSLFSVGTLSYIYLLFLKKYKRLLYLRIFLLIIILGFLLTIIWITTYKNKKLHYIFAFLIFSIMLLYNFLTYIAFRCSKLIENTLFTTFIINSLVLIGLVITGLSWIKGENTAIVFASLENTFLILSLVVILIIGFFC
jgi:hypothetical protein